MHAALALLKGEPTIKTNADFQELDNYLFHKENLEDLPEDDLESLPELLNLLDNDIDGNHLQDMPNLMDPADGSSDEESKEDSQRPVLCAVALYLLSLIILTLTTR